jgi:RNA polymerase sigma-70 factor (ECF subfamily)
MNQRAFILGRREEFSSFPTTKLSENMITVVQDLERPRMAPETAEDLALAEQASSGDESALTRLYERYADPLFAYIHHHLEGARPEAEEVWQDTLSAAIRALPAYRGQSRFFSWLCGIARHQLADFWRRRGRDRQELCLVSPEELTRLMDNGTVPEEILGQQATRLRVVETLGELPPDYRTALVARYADGQGVEFIAQLLGKSYKAAEATLSRAREASRQALAAQPENEP